MNRREKELWIILLKEKIKWLRKHSFVLVILFSTAFLMILSKATIGEAEVITFTVDAIGVSHGYGGNSKVLVSKLKNGSHVNIYVNSQLKVKTGSLIEVRSLKRMFGEPRYEFIRVVHEQNGDRHNE